ncbi:MAG: hypothetical protein IKP86_13920 [Anaerolineaceae bacterium]|nr:hypothetical protein [Anaerolineaceae bacterium]
MKKLVLFFLTAAYLVIAQTALAVDSIENPQLPPVIEEIVEEVQPVYTVTVVYIDVFGNEISESTTTPVEVGKPIEIPLPETPDDLVIKKPSVFEPMPTRDVEYTVIYIPEDLLKNPNFYLFTIDDYETPLGLGASQMNIGICVE